jgi:hypothetical protein
VNVVHWFLAEPNDLLSLRATRFVVASYEA